MLVVVPLPVELCLLFQVLLLIHSDAVHADDGTEVKKHQVLHLNTQSICTVKYNGTSHYMRVHRRFG